MDDRSEVKLVAAGVVGIGLFSLLAIVMAYSANRDVILAVVTFPVLLAISAPLFRWLSRSDRDPELFRILTIALVVKLLMSLARYYMAFVLYDGGDSLAYHSGGLVFAENFWSGDASLALGPALDSSPDGSRHIGMITGVVYILTGSSIYAGFFVFSWMSFMGNLALVRGLRRGFPEAHQRIYLLAALFLPSMLFWPSSIGKEAWMMLCIGLAGYGASIVLGPRHGAFGIVPLLVGSLGAWWVRPHMALVIAAAMLVALAVSYLAAPLVTQKTTTKSKVGRLIALGALFAVMLISSSQVNKLYDNADGDSTAEILQRTVDRTQQGGSSFEAQPVTNPLQLPLATVSVLFRPFPWEAGGANTLISSLEGIVFLAFLSRAGRSLPLFLPNLLRRPYLAFCFAYAMGFVVAFSSIANAGILARQRVQVLPFFLVLAAIPTTKWWQTKDASDENDAEMRSIAPETTSVS